MLIGLGWAASMPKRHSDNRLILTGLSDMNHPMNHGQGHSHPKPLAPTQMAEGTETDITHLD